MMIAHGTDEQKGRYLGPMLHGDEVWCQLFSEPAAGSDLAGIQSRAKEDNGGFVLNGQKVWTTNAHFASYGLLLARTDSRRRSRPTSTPRATPRCASDSASWPPSSSRCASSATGRSPRCSAGR